MCLIGYLIIFHVINKFIIVHSPQTIAWYSFTVIATVNLTMQLDEQELKLSAHIRYVYVLGNVLVTYNVMLITLAHISSTVQRVGHRSVEILKRFLTSSHYKLAPLCT
jgi:hypothetical protein